MVVDLHEDIGYHFMMGGAAEVLPFDLDVKGRHADLPKYLKSGMKLVLGSIFPLVGGLNPAKIEAMKQMYGTWSPSSALASPRDLAIELVKVYYGLEELYPDRLKIVRTREDIEGLAGKIGIILHLEGCEALGEAADLRIFYNLGLRSVGLTWNYDNKYAASCLSRKDYGLTGEGVELVHSADRLGMLVDLSHSSPKTAMETLQIAASSPYFSHSNALSLQESKRNISDDLIRETGRRGGVVGLTLIRSCIGPPFTPGRLAEHAKHLLKVGGDRLPALGTDYLGMASAPEELEDVSRLGVLRQALIEAGFTPERADGLLNDDAYEFIVKRSERW